MADATKPPVFTIGEVRGLAVTMTVSRKTRMSLIKSEFGNGDHIALGTQAGVKWTERPDVSGDHLNALFRELVHVWPARVEAWIWELYPEYNGIPLSRFGFQTAANDAISAAREDIHAHATFALDDTWYSGGIPRFTDPVAPVPADVREPRKK